MVPASKNLVDRTGVEPVTMPCKGIVFPTIPTAQIVLAPVERIELPLVVLETTALPLYYTGTNLHTETNVCIKAFFMDEPTCPRA